MWVFDKCCCCIELRTGCLIIGYLQLVTQVIMTIVSIVGVIIGAAMSVAPEEDKRKLGMILIISFVLILLILMPFLAVTITFVVGLHKNKPGHVKIYLIFSLVILVLGLLLTVVGVITGAVPWMAMIQQIFYIAVSLYYLLVIRSYWLLMLNGNAGPRVMYQ